MSDKLKPCPFCGGEVTLEKYTNPTYCTDSEGNTFWRDEPDGWMIECKNHGWRKDAKGVDVAADVALYSWGTSEENKRELIEAWNTRAERTCRYESTNRCTWVCTSCGREVEILHYGYNYCPNCGAKVVE